MSQFKTDNSRAFKNRYAYGYGAPFRSMAFAVAVATTLSGCVSTGSTPGGNASASSKNDLVSPCDVADAKYFGTAAGALLLGAVTYVATGRDAGAALAMTGVGGAIGYLIGQDIDNRRCEQWKIAQSANVDVNFDKISVHDQNADGSGSKTVGQAATWQGESHFRSNSATLTPEAEAYFTQVARTYVPKIDPKMNQDQRRELAARVAERRILIVGHSDDTGNSADNARLSEARAKAVGEIFRREGIDPARLYFQGSGETYPIADNRSAEGRAKNRRVEIVEVDDDQALQAYMTQRVPKTEYYRIVSAPTATAGNPGEQEQGAALSTSTSSESSQPRSSSGAPRAVQGDGSDVPPAPGIGRTAGKKDAPKATAKATSKAKFVDFGGEKSSEADGITEAMIGGAATATSNSVSSLFGISEAQANSGVLEASCVLDRPRIGGVVKRLSDGKERPYTTAEYLPGLYRTSYAAMVNGHLVGMNDVAVLREGSTPVGRSPIVLFKEYKGASDRNRKPDQEISTSVNVYQGQEALVYRVFAEGEGAAVRCLDVVFPNKKPFGSTFGKLYYDKNGETYAAEFKPQLTK